MIVNHNVGQFVKIIEPDLKARIEEIRICPGGQVRYLISYWSDDRNIEIVVADDEIMSWDEAREPLIISKYVETKTKK